MTEPSAEQLARYARALAPAAFNRTWELLDLPERDAEQEEEMLAAAFAQRHHWYQVGSPLNRAVADWQVARVLAVLGYAELADRFARHSLRLCETHDLPPFFRGYAHEAIARAADVMDDYETVRRHTEQARRCAALVADPDERTRLLTDVETVC